MRIAEWPRLQEHVERLIAEGESRRHEALGHLRCLEWYLQKVTHITIPRILRAAPTVSCGPTNEHGVVEESIELLDSFDGGDEVVIDVEPAILGHLAQRVLVKAEPRDVSTLL